MRFGDRELTPRLVAERHPRWKTGAEERVWRVVVLRTFVEIWATELRIVNRTALAIGIGFKEGRLEGNDGLRSRCRRWRRDVRRVTACLFGFNISLLGFNSTLQDNVQ